MNKYMAIRICLMFFLGIIIISGFSVCYAQEEIVSIGTAELEELVENSKAELTLVNFWATWCGPCRKEYAILKKVRSNESPEKLAIMGVSLDYDSGMVRDFAKRQKFNYPVYIDNGQLMQKYKISAIPRTLVFDKNKNIVLDKSGLISEDKILELIK